MPNFALLSLGSPTTNDYCERPVLHYHVNLPDAVSVGGALRVHRAGVFIRAREPVPSDIFFSENLLHSVHIRPTLCQRI